MEKRATIPIVKLTIPLILMTMGCSDNDERLVEYSRESLDRQADQNRVVAEQSNRVTDATQALVEADAAARKELAELQREIVQRDEAARQQLTALQNEAREAARAEQQRLDQQRDELERERRAIASARYWDPLLADAFGQAVWLVIAVLPLVFSIFLLVIQRSAGRDQAAVTELVLTEFVRRPELLLPSPAISRPALPASSDEDDLPAAATGDDRRSPED